MNFCNCKILAFDDFYCALWYLLPEEAASGGGGADQNADENVRPGTQGSRKKAGITHRELAAKLKREDGRSVDPPYLNAVEHDHRYPPEDCLIEQMAKIVGVSPDVLYFHANRQPPDVKTGADQERLEAAYRAFRRALGVRPPGKRK
jgi:transcriptional regulator with XRE-family HTH domain